MDWSSKPDGISCLEGKLFYISSGFEYCSVYSIKPKKFLYTVIILDIIYNETVALFRYSNVFNIFNNKLLR